ncbi:MULTISPECIES: cellulose-binding domain-containing protein [Streptomyces]|uniref:Cellulose-binding domain-containing protein n=1 Tax=Streptomyces doudnae TaxID=3075536 RepID=A0ABD5F0S9_9ACTN|nr:MULTISPECIES: cellulose-binding domain-containing protein [unclassified Streptomyces]MDT0440209.1 cellulose-binding domain-containing protein [Streptomyces sp. DSM 41981]MYQ64477.1 cellulose-binding protein [Streptomyces sp. SID4950]SCD79700.1 Cellulose binding domain-containing protein [Streptomyces sp. SolWspMP-5a-2]
MPDLPTPKDAAEAALFSECWDAVLSYADLCTAGSTAATRLAEEAFALGIREARAAESATARATGRRSPRLPVIPLLLTAVRTTAAAWETGGKGHDLDSDLRLWLNSDKAARYTGPPLSRPLALRGLRDLQEPDAALLWLAEVETLPLTVVARRLGLDPAVVGDELAQVRGLFRDRCHRAHLDSPMTAHCRSYAGLLDVVTRSPATDIPEDLSRHLSRCVNCAEAAACLRPHGGGLPVALVGGVIGWGGLAYLERRRRAAEVRLGVGRPEPAEGDGADPRSGAQRARVVRNSLLAAAVMVSLLALAVSMMPFGGSDTDDSAATPTGRQTSAPLPSSPVYTTPEATSSPPPATEASESDGGHGEEPQGTSSATASGTSPDGGGPTRCEVAFDLVNQWPDGFQATITLTTAEALDGWRVAWTFADGQRVGQMWDATVSQDGSRVTAVAADYNKAVAAGGTLSFGFLASWKGRNAPPHDFALNGRECAKAG